MAECKNCGMEVTGKYCSNCSQKLETHRLSVAHLAHEIFHAITHTDKGIIFLIKELFFNPGKVALEYNAGKRKKYFNPFSFLLIMMALQIFLSKKTDIFTAYVDASQEIFDSMYTANKMPRPEKDQGLQNAKVQTSRILENSRLITFLFIPFFALLTWLLFIRSGNNYAENLVLNVFLVGQTNVYFILFSVVPFVIYPPVVFWVMLLYPVIFFIYSLVAYKQFFKQRWLWTFLKGSALLILYFVSVQVITTIIINLFDHH
jgi:hypothetical protein